jgi:hypothetical protein
VYIIHILQLVIFDIKYGIQFAPEGDFSERIRSDTMMAPGGEEMFYNERGVSGQIDAQTELPQRKNPDTHLIRD